MDLAGKIKLIFDTQTFDSGFTKREFVVTTQEQYPQDVKFECIQDRVNLLDGMSVGDEINVHFNVKGREYNEKYFVNLQAWKIDKVAQEQAGGGSSDEPPADTFIPTEEGEEDDLPF